MSWPTGRFRLLGRYRPPAFKNLRGTFTFGGSQPGQLRTLTRKPHLDHAKRPDHLSDDTVRAGGRARLFLVGKTRLGSVAPVRDATGGVSIGSSSNVLGSYSSAHSFASAWPSRVGSEIAAAIGRSPSRFPGPALCTASATPLMGRMSDINRDMIKSWDARLNTRCPTSSGGKPSSLVVKFSSTWCRQETRRETRNSSCISGSTKYDRRAYRSSTQTFRGQSAHYCIERISSRSWNDDWILSSSS